MGNRATAHGYRLATLTAVVAAFGIGVNNVSFFFWVLPYVKETQLVPSSLCVSVGIAIKKICICTSKNCLLVHFFAFKRRLEVRNMNFIITNLDAT